MLYLAKKKIMSTIGAARYTANFTPSKLPFSIAV
jgi:hypothetical protein